MKLIVKGKQIDIGQALQTHIGERLNAIASKYFDEALEAVVVISREAHLINADVSLHVARNVLLQSTGDAEEAYAAFDVAADRMAKRLRRYKRRLRDYRKRPDTAPALTAQTYVLEAEPDDLGDDTVEAGDALETSVAPAVVAEIETPIDSLTVSEAVMRLDLGELPALMFRNPSHGGLNMIYRRSDGNIGWVDPRGTREHLVR